MKKGTLIAIALIFTFMINILGPGTLTAFAADEVKFTAPRTGDYITDKYNVSFTVSNAVKPASIRLVYPNEAGYDTTVQIAVKKETTAVSEYNALIDKMKEGNISLKVIVTGEDKKEYTGQVDVIVSKVLTNIMTDKVNVEPYETNPDKFKNELLRMNGLMSEIQGVTALDSRSVSKFVDTVITVANKEGVRPDVALSQIVLETGWLTFPGDVTASQNNFGGIGATGGVSGNLFNSIEEGIIANVQHLLAYASTNDPTEAVSDPRFHLVNRVVAPYVEYLGIKENPSGYGWAWGFQYGKKLLTVMDKFKNASSAPFDSSMSNVKIKELSVKPVEESTVSTGAISRLYGTDYNIGTVLRLAVATTSDTEQSFRITNRITGKTDTIPFTSKTAVDYTANVPGPYTVEAMVRQTGSAATADTKTEKIDISGDYVLITDVNAYETAENALAGTNKITVLKKGTYRFTEESNGAYSLDTPDGAIYWINPKDNVVSPGSTTPATTSSSTAGAGNTYTLVRDVNAYTSSLDAINRTNPVKTYYKGTYYIYKTASGVYNISKTQGTAGAWINPGDNVSSTSTTTPATTSGTPGSTPGSTSASTSTQLAPGSTYVLNNEVKGYTSSLDAINRVNPVAVYPAGSYYIYKIANGVYNITRTKGSAGVWMNPGDNRPASSPVTTKPSTTTPVTTTPATMTATRTVTQPVVTSAPAVGGKYVLNNDVKGYRTASDAQNRVNPVKIYMKGTFYVYKIYNGMLNLSTVAGSPGAWINPGDNKTAYKTVTITETVPVNTTTATTTPKTTTATTSSKTAAPAVGGKYVLNNDVRSYNTASDAMNRVNPGKIYIKGVYYIYKIYNAILNLTTVSGSPGAWINPADNKPLTTTVPVSTTTPKTTTTTVPTTTTSATPSGRYTLVTDLRVYSNADDARNRTNAVGTYRAGTYYIFRSVTGAINISTSQ